MGNIDLFHSRRTNYTPCKYWVRDERDSVGTPQEWILQNQPSGRFYAKELAPVSTQMDVVSGVWALDKNRVVLETDDDVDDIDRGCLIEYNGELWLVESVQRTRHRKESEFRKHPDYKYTINVVRG